MVEKARAVWEEPEEHGNIYPMILPQIRFKRLKNLREGNVNGFEKAASPG
jgi:hypothetical protein